MSKDQSACSFEAGIQVDGAKHGFERIHQKCGFLSPAAFLFTSAQMQITSELQPFRHINKVVPADQMGPQFRELTFRKMRETPEQFFGCHKPKHSITKEFQLLVVLHAMFYA